MFSFIYQIIKLLQNNIESLVVQGHNPIFSIYLSWTDKKTFFIIFAEWNIDSN